jgi:hypothetical protein
MNGQRLSKTLLPALQKRHLAQKVSPETHMTRVVGSWNPPRPMARGLASSGSGGCESCSARGRGTRWVTMWGHEPPHVLRTQTQPIGARCGCVAKDAEDGGGDTTDAPWLPERNANPTGPRCPPPGREPRPPRRGPPAGGGVGREPRGVRPRGCRVPTRAGAPLWRMRAPRPRARVPRHPRRHARGAHLSFARLVAVRAAAPLEALPAAIAPLLGRRPGPQVTLHARHVVRVALAPPAAADGDPVLRGGRSAGARRIVRVGSGAARAARARALGSARRARGPRRPRPAAPRSPRGCPCSAAVPIQGAGAQEGGARRSGIWALYSPAPVFTWVGSMPSPQKSQRRAMARGDLLTCSK